MEVGTTLVTLKQSTAAGMKVIQRSTSFICTFLCLSVLLINIHRILTKDRPPGYDDIVPLRGLADQPTYITSLCREKFNKTLQENIDVIKNYPKGDAEDFLWKIGGNLTSPLEVRRFPVFVTAIDKKYYPQSQGLFQHLHTLFLFNPKYAKDVYIVVYDLGMSVRQLNVLKKKCRCEIRKFPFEQFPQHVRTLKTYAFKPIIVQLMLAEFGFVWWMDSSIRFKTPNIDHAIQYAVNNSILFTVTTSDLNAYSLPKQTDSRMFQFFGEAKCKYRHFGEVWATTVLFHFDDITKYAVRAWVTCALNKECIAPSGSLKKLFCKEENTSDGRCHRFDQSALGIIAYRLFHERFRYPTDLSLNNIYEIKRGHIVNYFESCKIIALCM